MFYRQSDIPEIPELTWLLTCVTGKGLLNRAHAYKAAVDKNAPAGEDPDADVTAGLFMYPVLMAADILMFNAHKVPVGRDQVQHIEMARDIGQRFNHLYGEHFVLPEAVIEETVAHAARPRRPQDEQELRQHHPAVRAARSSCKKLIAGIVTDSRAPGEPKDTEGSALFQIYQAFAIAEETAAMRQAFADGIGWGDAKQQLFERIDREIAPMRARYDALIADPAAIEAVLKEGADKARQLAAPLMVRLRQAVGLRALAGATAKAAEQPAEQATEPAAGKSAGKASTSPPAGVEPAQAIFKQYRERDGRFYYKLVGAQGRVLMQSRGFASPQEAGRVIADFQARGAAALAEHATQLQELPDVTAKELGAVLDRLVEK